MLASLIASAISLILRFRRSTGLERQQLKWVASAAGLVAVAWASGPLLFWWIDDGPWEPVLLLAVATIPIAAGIAILRYRLYELDRIVNRAVVYGAVSALLAGAYFGIVLGLQEVFSSFGGGSDLAIAVSTLAVAALFRPMRDPSPADSRPALLPPALRRAEDARGVRGPPPRRGRHRVAPGRAHRRGGANAGTQSGVALAPRTEGAAMSRRGTTRLAWAVCAIAIALAFAALVFLILNSSTPGVSNFGSSRIGDALFGSSSWHFRPSAPSSPLAALRTRSAGSSSAWEACSRSLLSRTSTPSTRC